MSLSGEFQRARSAHRANRIAHALVRDHASYEPTRWT